VPEPFAVLLDQNVPREVASWLRGLRPSWDVRHAAEVGLAGKTDREVFEWAAAHQAEIITFDEDFADRRSFRVREHHGMVRLRVWPTTVEETQAALERLLAEVPERELTGALVIIDRARIRVRPGWPGNR
jgi:predicted nuclease of predicted toxin-antitoxin system